MKYIHDYKDGSFCMSDTFKDKIGQPNYLQVSDDIYEDLVKGKRLLQNGLIVNNPNYVEHQL